MKSTFSKRLAPVMIAALAAMALAACQHVPQQAEEPTPQDMLDEARQVLAEHPHSLTPTPGALPLFEVLQARPLDAAYRAGMIEHGVRRHVDSPHTLFQLATSIGGEQVFRPPPSDEWLKQQADPLTDAMQRLGDNASPDEVLPPDTAALPASLRGELALLLDSVGRAERFRQRAFAALPPELTPERLLRQVVDGRLAEFETPDVREWVPQVEYAALAAGMQDLAAATERMVHALRTTPDLPALRWDADTALGRIVIDTREHDHHHALADSLLIIDLGGNDRYTGFAADNRRISLVIDVAGDDCHEGSAGAVLGYAVVWDAAGNDRHGPCSDPDALAPRLAQGAALFGAALLVDEDGDDDYRASTHAQAWALAGQALLVDHRGDDRHHALAFAQGSAGPRGVAMLIDAHGNDSYTLAAEPLVRPSSQLRERNVSMGQGASLGLRAEFTDGRSLPGGFGALIDLDGDDRYTAQVFAQGAGYQQGIGVLIDGGGDDEYQAAWYGLAAAAHQGIGIFIDRGNGDDRYRVSHSTSLATAHDRSIAFFVDEGGDDHYRHGRLGFGAAHDNGVAVFAELGGDDDYQLGAGSCMAFGAAHINHWGTLRESLPNIGLFMDLGGTDRYPAYCTDAGDDRTWRWRRAHPEHDLPSKHGHALDGEHAAPFHSRPRSAPPNPVAD
ncbi:MAG: hypothetical protein H2060_00080 [Azoarcus sp.]|nr:hypothetical protein [Azoarcus sp.]